jgi:drug/metabolite transporter (DMT)-like permease
MAAALALLSSLLWGGADFLGGTLSRRLPVLRVVGGAQLAGLVAVLALAVALRETAAPLDYLPWAVLAGLAGLVGLLSFYAALAAGTMGVVSPVAALGVAVPVLVGLARGERPGAVQLAGIGLAVAGVVLASGPELSGRSGARPLLLAGLAAVGFGLTLLFIAEGARTSTVMTLVVMRLAAVLVVVAAVAVLAVRSRRWPVRLRARDRLAVLLVGLADVGANLAFGLASTRGLVSVVAVLGSLYPLATVLLARAVHGERLAAVQNVGVAVALGGVCLIAVG